ncbi:unnamed protein product [Calicophoron daubneyi]|uniref:EGF-like domain-containing protein n=1 Tax=Calicophoron daubneyi TaxID=300641 RepID=A0AAV2SYU4_CALDB
MYDLFLAMTENISTTELDFWIIEEKEERVSDWNASIRVIYNEVIRPRYYLKFYIDAYRYLLEAQKSGCKVKKDDKKNSCAAIFPQLKRTTPYEHVLWLYNWVICNKIGSDPELDVDAICPLVCRPHSAKTLAARKVIVGPSLLYREDANEDMLDVCEQLQHAVPGTCTLSKVGVQMNHFSCQCASAAYEWAETGTVRGCLVSKRVLQSFEPLTPNNTGNDRVFEQSGNSLNSQNETVVSIWRMNCTVNETETFCDGNHTSLCYYRVQKLSDGELNETSRVRQTMRPFCHCKKRYAGLYCNESFNPCVHQNRHAINNAKSYLTRHISDPFFLPEDPSSASGNYLCGFHSGQGECRPTGMYGNFTCDCAKGYAVDKYYSNYSNCAKELPPAADTCGRSRCLHDGKCVKKTVDGKVPDSSTPAHQIVEVCECKEGYVGPLCELMENTWSEWEAWGPCTPHCGSKRYKFRIRLCIGEIGCIGSALESARCEDKPCPLLNDLEKMVKSPDIQSIEGTYYRASRATMLTWMLALVLPVELILVIAGLIILEKFILHHR